MTKYLTISFCLLFHCNIFILTIAIMLCISRNETKLYLHVKCAVVGIIFNIIILCVHWDFNIINLCIILECSQESLKSGVILIITFLIGISISETVFLQCMQATTSVYTWGSLFASNFQVYTNINSLLFRKPFCQMMKDL